jgi:phosphoenolpyruvate carboxykinase (GTP)
MELVSKDTIFTNTALTSDGDVWWEGMSKTIPAGLIDWRGNVYDPGSDKPAAHPNARFTSPAKNCPTISADWDSPEGVELDAIIFGGRKSNGVPLVTESDSWQHGVFLGATMASEQTAAAEGVVGEERRDPFAMIPFCGYNMASYWDHWLNFDQDNLILPKIFKVNWFLKNGEGKFIWPGFSENSRVLRWIVQRVDDTVKSNKTAIGSLPYLKDLGVSELGITKVDQAQLLSVDRSSVIADLASIEIYFNGFGDELPSRFRDELAQRQTAAMDLAESQ